MAPTDSQDDSLIISLKRASLCNLIDIYERI
jgi:hypothetical protein